MKEDKSKPTIAEVEALMDDPNVKTKILPDGTIEVTERTPQDLAERVTGLEIENRRLCEELSSAREMLAAIRRILKP